MKLLTKKILLNVFAIALLNIIQHVHAGGIDDAEAGDAAKARRDYDKAIALYSKALHSGDLNYSNQAVVLNNRASAYANQKKFTLAIDDFNLSLRLRPNADVFYNRALTFAQNRQYDQSIADYTEAINLAPKRANFYLSRGAVYALMQKYKDSIADFTKAIDLNSRNADAYNLRGIAFSRDGQNDLALSDFSTAIKLKPEFSKAYWNRGFHYFVQGQLIDAERNLNQAYQLNQSDLYNALWLHIIRKKNGNNIDILKSKYSESNSDEWPGPLIALFNGKSSIERVRFMNAKRDAHKAHENECEANFFIGEYELMRERTTEAVKLFNHVADSCKTTINAIAAKAELRLLKTR